MSHKAPAVLRVRYFDLSLHTAYAQAKEIALAQAAVPLLTAGSLQTEQRSGGEFVYRYRYDASGRRINEYLGAASDPQTAVKAERARAEIAEQAAIAEHSRRLRKIGFYSADNSTLVTVASLFNAGVFRGGGVLVGTHAYGAILNELGVSASPFPMTEDVDLASGRSIEIAALPQGGLLALLRQTGLPFHEAPALERGGSATSFKVRGRSLKVDLLVPARGKPYVPVLVPELDAHAIALPYLQYLLRSTISSVLIGRDRIAPVTVPHPGWFCLHKLALYALRTGAENPKRDKDVYQGAVLAMAMAHKHDFLLIEAIEAMDRKLKAAIRPGVERALSLIGEDQPEVTSLLGPYGGGRRNTRSSAR